jgi:MFS transporter, DHA1 family, multidrug resistance protein
MKLNKDLAILFFIMVVVQLGFGIVLPIMPFYIESFGATASGLGMLMAIFSIMQFISAPVFGGLSDRYGRKGILMLGIFGNGLSLLLFGLSTQLWQLYIYRALAGLLSAATLPTAMAIIGDSTDEKERSAGMGFLGAAMGVGMILGPGIGGWLGSFSTSMPFFFAAALSAVGVVLVLVAMPETLPIEKRAHHTVRISGPSLGMMWKVLFGSLGFIFFLGFLVNFGLASFESVYALYAEHRFAFGPDKVGTILVVVGIVSTLIQGALTGPATRRFGESFIIKSSLIASAVTFVLMILAFDYLTILLATGVFIFSNAMLRPSISSLISKGSEMGQGVAMGIANSYMSLGRIVGPLMAGALFDVQIRLPYLVSAGIMLVIYLMSLYWLRGKELPVVVIQPAIGE